MRQAFGAHLRHHEELIWLLPVAGASVLLFLAAQLAGLPHGVSAAAVLGDYAWKVLRARPCSARSSSSLCWSALC